MIINTGVQVWRWRQSVRHARSRTSFGYIRERAHETIPKQPTVVTFRYTNSYISNYRGGGGGRTIQYDRKSKNCGLVGFIGLTSQITRQALSRAPWSQPCQAPLERHP